MSDWIRLFLLRFTPAEAVRFNAAVARIAEAKTWLPARDWFLLAVESYAERVEDFARAVRQTEGE